MLYIYIYIYIYIYANFVLVHGSLKLPYLGVICNHELYETCGTMLTVAAQTSSHGFLPMYSCLTLICSSVLCMLLACLLDLGKLGGRERL